MPFIKSKNGSRWIHHFHHPLSIPFSELTTVNSIFRMHNLPMKYIYIFILIHKFNIFSLHIKTFFFFFSIILKTAREINAYYNRCNIHNGPLISLSEWTFDVFKTTFCLQNLKRMF